MVLGEETDQPEVFIGGQPYEVIGILANSARMPRLAFGVIIPDTAARHDFGLPQVGNPAAMLVETDIGAAQVVAEQLPLALRWDLPEALRALAPPDPRSLQADVTADVNQLFLVLAGLSIVIGAIGIANTTLVAILERTPEIGLRRALGARPRHIAGQFLAESTLLGGLGGLTGGSLGIVVVVLAALVRGWSAVFDARVALAAPVVGALIGLVAGTYPALRAASVEPIKALQG